MPDPGKPPEQTLQLPSSVIERLRSTVFGFDTFFVTSVENYQADGVLFKGNLRGNPADAYRRASERLKVCCACGTVTPEEGGGGARR